MATGLKNGPAARRAGFTIIELLTVMGIMLLILGIGVVSFLNMQRGAELRGAVSAVRSVLSLARQHAVTRRTETMVIFRQTASNAYYMVFEKAGVVAAAGQPPERVMTDDKAVWTPAEHAGRWVANFRDGSFGTVRTNDSNRLELQAPGLQNKVFGVSQWQTGDVYGWAVGERTFLPPGAVFRDGNPADAPDAVIFLPNGGVSSAQPIELREAAYGQVAAGKRQKAIIIIWPLTGLSKVTMTTE